MRNQRFNHKRYFQEQKFRKPLSKFSIRTGMIVHFNYPGWDRKPTVFVMDTNEVGQPDNRSFSGINLDYLPIKEVNMFFMRALNRMSWEVDKLTKFPRGRLYDEEVGGLKPIALYNSVVKRTVLLKRDCWRTYKYKKVKGVEQVKWKFSDPPLNQIWQNGFKKLNKLNVNEVERRLKENHQQKDINFNKPNFDSQWSFLQNYQPFKDMGESNSKIYVNSNSKIYRFSTIKSSLNNAHVNFDRLTKLEKQKFESDYKKSQLDTPVVLKLNNNKHELVSGQTNLAGCFNKNINTKMLIVDMTLYSKNPEKYKKEA
tara:strand:+ start:545 stop:1483 length:939 start_codon:yes stop_codon:yes gene_type:complete